MSAFHSDQIIRTVFQKLNPTHLDAARMVVDDAEVQFKDASTKRSWAVEKLSGTLHLPENIIRLLIEIAVMAMQHELDKEKPAQAPSKP